jgi:hypothetical protein
MPQAEELAALHGISVRYCTDCSPHQEISGCQPGALRNPPRAISREAEAVGRNGLLQPAPQHRVMTESSSGVTPRKPSASSGGVPPLPLPKAVSLGSGPTMRAGWLSRSVSLTSRVRSAAGLTAAWAGLARQSVSGCLTAADEQPLNMFRVSGRRRGAGGRLARLRVRLGREVRGGRCGAEAPPAARCVGAIGRNSNESRLQRRWAAWTSAAGRRAGWPPAGSRARADA